MKFPVSVCASAWRSVVRWKQWLVPVVASCILMSVLGCGGNPTPAATTVPSVSYLSPNYAVVPVGYVETFVAFSKSSAGVSVLPATSVKWSSNSAAGTIDASGHAMLGNAGSAIFAGAAGSSSASSTIVAAVGTAVPVSVLIQQTFFFLGAGQWQATVSLSDGSSMDVTHYGVWSSTDNTLIAVDPLSGATTALAKSGQAYITFQYGSLSDSKLVVLQ